MAPLVLTNYFLTLEHLFRKSPIHIASALSLWKVRESESEAIFALSEAKIIPYELAEKIKGMPSFRNRIIHDYLPNEFDAEKLFEALAGLDDFKKFSNYVLEWLSENNKTSVS